MKRSILTVIFVLAVISPVFSSETGGEFSIVNRNLVAESISSTSFSGTDLLWGGNLYWKEESSDVSGVEVGFSRDDILNNIGYTKIYYNADLFNISVGPFFGLFNSKQNIIKSGIDASVKLNFTGIAFIEFQAKSTIGGRLTESGDYIQEANSLSIGFYVYNAIVTLMMNNKNYSLIDSDSINQNVDFTEYALLTDIFQKNVPYSLKIKIAYQQKEITQGTEYTKTLNSVVIGTDLLLTPARFLSITAGIDVGVYTFGSLTNSSNEEELLTFTDGISNFLFNASLGFTLDLDNIKK